MKIVLFVCLAVMPWVSGCKKETLVEPVTLSTTTIRSIAWDSLDSQSKATVIVNWKDSPAVESTYQNKKVYEVRFNTSDDALLGPIVVYVDRYSMEVVGKALRH